MAGKYRGDHEPGDEHGPPSGASAGYGPSREGRREPGRLPGEPPRYGRPYAEHPGRQDDRPEPHGDSPGAYGGRPESPGESAGPYGEPAEFYGESLEEESSLVRLYAVTGGRTAPPTRLAMEALVSSATSAQLGLSYIREYRAISELCRQVRSVAEISALLGVPLGVARVLISDMESEGLVRVHHPHTEEGGPDLGLLERVLSGLHRL